VGTPRFAEAPTSTEDIPLAHFNLYRSKGGYGFEVTYPEGRFDGWRPTRNWAKKAAQRKVLEVMDIDPGSTATFAPADHERLFSQGHSTRSHRFDPFRNGGIWIVAVVVVIVLLAASAVYVVHRSSKPAEFTGPFIMTIDANSRLQPVLGQVLNDFKLIHPEINVVTQYGSSKDFETKAQKGDISDVYIDSPTQFDWITGYVAPDGTESQMGFDVLEMVVKSNNPQHISDMTSIANNPKIKLGTCIAFLPCGLAAQTVLQGAQVTQTPTAPNAMDAKSNIDRVALGSVDTAFVFRTDYALHPVAGLTPITLDTKYQVRVDYEVRKGHKTLLSQEFIDFLHSNEGSAALHRVGLLSA
jgi:ABC-type molybdate transport system substrate-binding protein